MARALAGLALGAVLGMKAGAASYGDKRGKVVVTAPAAPVFSVAGGVFTNSISLELKAAGAQVRYTLDGSEPTADSPVGSNAIAITGCTLVRARAWYPDGTASRVVSGSYVVAPAELLRLQSNLPLVVVQTPDEDISSEDKSLTALRILNAKTGDTSLASAADFTGLAVMNVRGHSSLRYPKRSYTVKLVDDALEPVNDSLLGMARDSAWVLYGPYPDKTLVRDALAYELSREMGRWAPQTRFVEAFVHHGAGTLSGEDYAGVYLLVERVTRGKGRVNITKLEAAQNSEPEISGGYIFKKDHAGAATRKRFGAEGPPMVGRAGNVAGFPTPPGAFPADPGGFLPPFQGKVPVNERNTVRRNPARPAARDFSRPFTNYVAMVPPPMSRLDEDALFEEPDGFRTALQRNEFFFYEPEPDEITPVQRAWLKDYVNRIEAVLYGPDFKDPEKGYRAFIDVDSFIDYHLLVELTKNVDGFRFSTFYYKDRGGKLQMGPAWDWNLAFGNCDGKQGYMPERWLWPQLDDQQYSWFRRLFEDPDFGQRFVDRLAQWRTNVFATSNVLGKVDRMAAQLRFAQQRNFSRWEILGRDISPNYFVGSTYVEELNWMKNWIEDRLAWIENQFIPAPQIKGAGPLALASAVPDAKIYYTTEGSDPRASGGNVSATARLYEAPLSLPKGATLTARVQAGTRWSAPVRTGEISK